VQKAADKVRVNVQLVNALTDSHLWANTNDRKLTDIFGVESEIAKRIAESLQAKLTGREEQALSVKPTDNPEAYDAYLRGLAFAGRSHFSSVPGPSSVLTDATAFYERAVEVDPNFALAWARGFLVPTRISTSAAPIPMRPLGVMRRNVLWRMRRIWRRTRLKPCSPWVIINTGCCEITSLPGVTFQLGSKMLPSSSEIPRALGLIAQHEGQWDQSVAYFEQALVLDARNVELLMETAWNYIMLRQFPAGLKLYDRALDITPYDPDLMAAKASIY
jgi:tetratricopeptide (TPR) repeat protein